jgi:chaperone LolA
MTMVYMRRSILFAAILIALGAAAAVAQDDAAVMAALRAKYKGISTIRTLVTQTMCSAATGTCQRFAGHAEMKRPAKLRLDIDQPDKQVIVCDGAMLTLYVEQPTPSTWARRTRP